MEVLTVVGLVTAAAVLVYLVVALLSPESLQ